MSFTKFHIGGIAFLFAAAFLWSGCKKDFPKGYSEVPEIRLVSVKPTSIQQFQDSIIIQLEHKDGDGDLGFEHPDSTSLRVQDARLTKPDWYFVKPLAPVGSNVPIEGILTFRLSGTFLLGNGNQETTTFTIDLKDRKEHWSNQVVTPTITITK